MMVESRFETLSFSLEMASIFLLLCFPSVAVLRHRNTATMIITKTWISASVVVIWFAPPTIKRYATLAIFTTQHALETRIQYRASEKSVTTRYAGITKVNAMLLVVVKRTNV